jgi:hypothetical protein
MKNFVLILFITLNSILLFGQKFGVQTYSAYSNEALDIETDNLGNSYVTGFVTGETEFSSSVSVLSAPGNGDVYVAKYSPNGNLIWMKQFGGNFMDRAYDLDIGPDQNIVVTGIFSGSVQFGSTNLQSSQGSKDIFLLKLNPQGNVIWARKEGGGSSENSYGVAIDNQNNVILTGQFEGNTTIANQNFTSIIDPLTNLPSFDFFISKYDGNGSPLWVKVGAGKKEDRGMAVDVDSQNNIFLCGQYSDTLQFAGTTINNIGFNVGFVTKLSPSGQVQFFNNLRAGSCIPYGVKVNASDQVVLTGDFLGNLIYSHIAGTTSITNPFSKRVFVLQINNNGQHIWSYTLGSDNELSARALAIDSNKDVYVVGYFKCALTQLHQAHTALWNTIGYRDTYLLKVSNTGVFKYAKQMGGHFNDNAHGISVPSVENPIICGSFIYDFCVMRSPEPYPLNALSEYEHQLSGYANNEMNANGFKSPKVLNSYILKAVNNDNYDLNFFKGGILDTAESFLFRDWDIDLGYPIITDTVYFCEDTYGAIYNYSPTFEMAGPRITFSWINGISDTSILMVANTGYYGLTVSRLDGCASSTDSIYVIFEPNPTLPFMSDNLNLAVNEPGIFYWHYRFCSPDSVQISFSNLCTGCSIDVGNSIIHYQDTLPHYYYDLGGSDTSYFVNISRGHCTNSGYFIVGFDRHQAVDSLNLGIVLSNPPNYGDTITICQGSGVFVYGVDLNVCSAGNYPFIHQPWLQYQWLVDGNINSNQDTIGTIFIPNATGWYTFELNLTLGKIDLCDSVVQYYHALDSFYIILTPPPAPFLTTISGNWNSVLCAGTTGTLTASPTHPNYSWSGSGIISTSADGGTIVLNQPGNYSYSGFIVDSTTGCTTFHEGDQVLINGPIVPNLADYVNSTLICPNSSTQFSLPPDYQSYTWFGPNGNVISTTNTCVATIAGFYYCTLIDANYCNITTSPFELYQYQTPSIVVNPQNFICGDESLTITVVYSGSPTILWSPSGFTGDQLIVNEPGTYSVSVNQCDITTTFEEIILDGSFSTQISSTETHLCYGDEILISGNTSNVNYQWSNGQNSGQFFSATEPGTYCALVTNQFGCEFATNCIVITGSPESTPPLILSQSICENGNVTFNDFSSFVLNWYDLDSNFLFSNNSLTLNNVGSDTTFLVAYDTTNCPPVFSVVSVDFVTEISDFSIIGNTHLCENDSSFLQLIHDPTITFRWFNGDTINSTIPIYETGTYSITLYQCDFETIESVNIVDASFSSFLSASDTLFCLNNLISGATNSVNLTVSPITDQITWSNGETGVNEMIVSNPGTYYATLTNEFGCASQTAPIDIYGIDCDGVIPNVITANGDGVNDYFIINAAPLLPNNRLLIINRWGNVILDEYGYRNSFNALNVVDGVYFYTFYSNFKENPAQNKQGFFHVIR